MNMKENLPIQVSFRIKQKYIYKPKTSCFPFLFLDKNLNIENLSDKLFLYLDRSEKAISATGSTLSFKLQIPTRNFT